MWQVLYDNIKSIAKDGKFIPGLIVFNIVEPNSMLIIVDLAESIQECSQKILHLFTVHSFHKKKIRNCCSP